MSGSIPTSAMTTCQVPTTTSTNSSARSSDHPGRHRPDRPCSGYLLQAGRRRSRCSVRGPVGSVRCLRAGAHVDAPGTEIAGQPVLSSYRVFSAGISRKHPVRRGAVHAGDHCECFSVLFLHRDEVAAVEVDQLTIDGADPSPTAARRNLRRSSDNGGFPPVGEVQSRLTALLLGTVARTSDRCPTARQHVPRLALDSVSELHYALPVLRVLPLSLAEPALGRSYPLGREPFGDFRPIISVVLNETHPTARLAITGDHPSAAPAVHRPHRDMSRQFQPGQHNGVDTVSRLIVPGIHVAGLRG